MTIPRTIHGPAHIFPGGGEAPKAPAPAAPAPEKAPKNVSEALGVEEPVKKSKKKKAEKSEED